MTWPSRFRCAVCKETIGRCTASVIERASPGANPSRRHSDREIADHIRAELVRRGYPDPWRTQIGAAQ